MIFKTEAEDFHLLESYKERNLYYKILGGYLFNEIIAGYDNRKKDFVKLLSDITDDARVWDPEKKINAFLKDLEPEPWNMTFDYHTSQIFKEDKIEDGGEMSDVLILTKTKMISIECKFLSNFSIQKI